MSSVLEQNIAGLQELLDMVNDLPEAGPGLPEGLAAVASGTFTTTSMITANYTITHGLGMVPDISVLVLLDDVESTPITQGQLVQVRLNKNATTGSKSATALGMLRYSVGGSFSGQMYDDTQVEAATETTETFYNQNYIQLPEGRTYRWICCVLDRGAG